MDCALRLCKYCFWWHWKPSLFFVFCSLKQDNKSNCFHFSYQLPYALSCSYRNQPLQTETKHDQFQVFAHIAFPSPQPLKTPNQREARDAFRSNRNTIQTQSVNYAVPYVPLVFYLHCHRLLWKDCCLSGSSNNSRGVWQITQEAFPLFSVLWGMPAFLKTSLHLSELMWADCVRLIGKKARVTELFNLLHFKMLSLNLRVFIAHKLQCS